MMKWRRDLIDLCRRLLNVAGNRPTVSRVDICMKLRGCRRAVALAVLVVVAAACTSACGGTAAIKPFAPVRAPQSFVGVRALPGHSGTQAVTISDAIMGRIQRVVLADPWHGMDVVSTAVDAVGRIWVTLANGPRCTSNVAGCGPVPDSCAGEVVRIEPSTGALTTVLKASASELIGDAQPSPDGKLVAYLDGSCDRSFFNQHLRVRDIGSGRSWSIGTGLAVCHSLGRIAWTKDGSHLVVSYGQSRLAQGT